jgi:serine/threonine-protein kinase RsbW
VASSDESTLPYSLELAVYETCTNIVQHAYVNSEGHIEIELTIENNPLRLVVDLYDTGKPFKMAEIPSLNLDIPQEHGYGLFLVRQLMDEVSYQPGSEKNHWKLVKNL